MGADFPDTSSRSSSDDDDDPEAALNPHGEENDNVAPLFRLRRLPPQGGEDGSAVLLPGEGTVMSVYMMMHRYAKAAYSGIREHGSRLTGWQDPAPGYRSYRYAPGNQVMARPAV
jgi:hypothetical protein